MGRVIAVTGGRDFKDVAFVYRVLDAGHANDPISEIVHGGAWGADRIAYQWSVDRGVGSRQYQADWAKDGLAAGPIRNRRMLVDSKPSVLVAFPGGRGTADCVRAAKELEIRVFTPKYKEGG